MKELTFSQKSLDVSYKVRWLMLALIMLELQFFPVSSEDWPNIYLFLSIAAIYNIITRFLNLPELFERTKNICYGETVMDTIFLIGIISFTQGANSPFWVFFIIVIMFSATYYSGGKTFLVTIGISLLYILTCLLSNASFYDILSILSLKIPILLATCGLSIFSALEIRKQEGEIEIEKERTKYILKAFHHNVVAIQRKNKMLSELYNISIKPHINSNLSQWLTDICNVTLEFLNIDIAGIWIMEKNKESLKLTSSRENIPLPFKEKIRIGEGIIGRVALKKEPLIINELLKWDPYQFKDGPSSCIALPLIINSELLGVFLCASSGKKEFEDEDLKFLLLIGCRTSLSIKNTFLNEEIKRMTITDELTGLYNYRYFIETLKKEVYKGEKLSTTFSLLLIDIDNFKAFNEKYGHHIGNQMISLLALHLTTHLRGIDFLARFGEEEFAIILSEVKKDEGIMVAERIRKGVEGAVLIENTEQITVSIGVSSFPEDGNKFDEIILYADKAMFLAKEKGKNKVIGWRRR